MCKTLSTSAEFTGTGLHGGRPVKITVSPAASGTGVVFVRVDAEPGQQTIPARYDLVTDTQLCTKLSNEYGVSVGTVEHVMAAIAGCGITDARITLDGPEVPIMDGSSEPFVRGFAKAGIVDHGDTVKAIRIIAPIVVEEDGKRAALVPSDRMEMNYAISFEDEAIGEQQLGMKLANGAFVDELSDCRTFGHLREVEQLRSMGLAKGGGLHNAIVVDNGRVLNPEGLRRPDEFVRHKMLDAVGDLALAGAPIIGRYEGYKAGHGITNRLLRALFANPEVWTWDTLPSEQVMGSASIQAESTAPVAALAV